MLWQHSGNTKVVSRELSRGGSDTNTTSFSLIFANAMQYNRPFPLLPLTLTLTPPPPSNLLGFFFVLQPVLHVLPVHSQRVYPTRGVLRPPRRFPRPVLRQRE